MTDPSLALQDAVEAALSTDGALAADMGGTVAVFTMTAPKAAPARYLVIGEDQIIPENLDRECAAADDAYTRVHVWVTSDAGIEASRREAKVIAGHVRRILSDPLILDGFEVVDQICDMVEHLTDPNGVTAHSVVDHRFHLEPA